MPSASTGSKSSNVLLGLAALAGIALLTGAAGHVAERRHPPAGRFLEIDGVRLHYLEAGEGPPVVLLHGNGASANDFVGCGLFQALAARHRVIAFDRPGFGFSERPRPGMWPAERQAQLLAHACQVLGVEDPVVLGHSWGTQVALALAMEPESDVRGLVLVSGYYFPTLRLDAPLLGSPRLPLIGDAMRYTVSALLARAMLPGMLRQMFHPRPVAPEFLAAVPKAMMLRPWQLRASAEASWLMPGNARRLAEHYGELRIPVEIFAGTADRVADQHEQSGRLHRVLADSTLHLLPGEGHMLHYGSVESIARAVERLSPIPQYRGSAPMVEAHAGAS